MGSPPAACDTDARPRTALPDLSDAPQSLRSMSLSSSTSSAFPSRAHSSPAPRPRRRASQGSVSAYNRLNSPLSRLISKDKPGLQLPFFNSLGISYQSLNNPPISRLGSEPMSLDSPSDHLLSGPLTPPADEEDEHTTWEVVQDEPVTEREPKHQTLMDQSRDRHSASPSNPHQPQHISFNPMSNRPSLDEDEHMSGQDVQDEVPGRNWLENALDAIFSALLFDPHHRADSMRLVSQTLPFPRSPENNVQLPTLASVFGTIIEALRNRHSPEHSPYIHVTHAVPNDFIVGNLPTSPPSTPGPMVQSNDYFDPPVFASASTVPIYHNVKGQVCEKVNYPHPIVPPYSTHISVLERYIPPSTKHEYRDLFTYKQPSALADRMLELSPLGGCLLFIYPTKKGATTFKSQYLGPILDPLLRQLVVVNGFSADISRDLGRLEAVNSMDDFQTMKANIELLCRLMSENMPSVFQLVNAGKGLAPLDRNLWMEWYIQQERPRMKYLLSRNWQTSGRLTPSSPEGGGVQLSSSMLLGEIMDGIKRRRYDVSPKEDIELGVFVIRRSRNLSS
ncbi:hypothetical protein BGW36DRAFT_382719 [Talaromyces proteolyticus]|uniref:Uncharacterized protein n=1 Tax=Talaromyces proteolyticus TaxID=1131652 RepID=A0AAD4KRK9_9EURO|nr:uncharacterized protein BGW36DRAFT_382719 [Talaromyces proteolyticus]KAH8695451.1 hypothetical protein BGW36DRAFT_382719 [Talaromyces proteolyticus]